MVSIKLHEAQRLQIVRFFTRRGDFYNAYEALKDIDEPLFSKVQSNLDKVSKDTDFYRPPPG